MANKGKDFEKEVIKANLFYKDSGQALIQKISTQWNIVRRGKEIIDAYPEGKSTLDFRGTIRGGIPISFDCKETLEHKGLPLANIEPHQIQYMKDAILVNETTFILCHLKKIDKKYYIPGETVIDYWNLWQENKGKVGFNFIPVEEMEEIFFNEYYLLDYLQVIEI
nr:Holliday junction resolvase RecU [Clostridium sp. YIM B02551]